MLLKYGRGLLFGGAIVALALGATVMSILPQSRNQVAEQQPVVAPAANVAHATQPDLEVEAIDGTLSDFRGEVTKYADDLWTIEDAENGKRVVRASAGGTILTMYYEDERDPAVAEILSGTAGAFMDVLISVSQNSNCDENPGTGISCISGCSGCSTNTDQCYCLAYCGCRGQGGLCSWGTEGGSGCTATCCDAIQN